MVNILLVDDDTIKIKDVRFLVEKIPEITNFDIASDIISAKKMLLKVNYDLLILDLNLPLRIGDDPSPENGKDFLIEIEQSKRIKKPFHIIGLTAFDDFKSMFNICFEESLWALISYNKTSNRWEQQIKNKIEYLVQSKRNLLTILDSTYQYDLAIITALHEPELDAILNLVESWEKVSIPNDSTEYYKSVFSKDGKSLNVIAAATPQMGMVAATTLSLKMIQNFRPKILAMTGIAGGIEGKGNFGDILVADISFDYGSGKYLSNMDNEGVDTFEPDYKSINISSDIKEAILAYQKDKSILSSIKSKWIADKPDTELKLLVGPVATGASVVEDEKIVNNIKKHGRKLIGIDMETYGVFYAANNCSSPKPKYVMSFKSISDFANPQKNDKYQKYASYTSAQFLFNFVLDKVIIE